MSKKSDLDLLEFGTILAKRKKIIISIVFICTVIGFALAFILPKSYTSEVSFIVTDGNSINIPSAGILSGLANLSSGGSNVTADQVLVLIRNKEIQDQVIDEFNFREVLNTNIPEALRRKLNNRIIIEEKREGGLGFNTIIAITLKYTDGEPERAYNLLNFYYDQVDKKVQEINRKNVEDGFFLLRNRLEQNEEELREAEDSLVAFQTKYGILEVEETAKAQIQGIAEIRTQIVALEVEIAYLKEILGANSSKINDLQIQKQELQNKYDELVTGNNEVGENTDIFQSVQQMPGLFLEYLRRYRDVVVQEEIYKVLYPQYEQQKLNYEEVTSGLQIIDPAMLPTYKSGPKRAYIIIAAFLFGSVIALLIALLTEWKSNLKANNPDEYSRVQELGKALKSWK